MTKSGCIFPDNSFEEPSKMKALDLTSKASGGDKNPDFDTSFHAAIDDDIRDQITIENEELQNDIESIKRRLDNSNISKVFIGCSCVIYQIFVKDLLQFYFGFIQSSWL